MKRSVFLNITAVALGGAIGSVFRYLLGTYTLWIEYPLGTAVVNVCGSLLLGLLTGWVLQRKINDVLKNGIGVGFCGGFTTMSAFAADLVLLFEQALFFAGVSYLLLSVIGGLTAAFIGIIIGSKLGHKGQLRRGETNE